MAKMASVAPAPGGRKVVVLSDIHIGTNAPTNWYQKDLHEPYLSAILDWVIREARSVQELILLGDIVDFWTYPPEQQPPSFDEIMEANPNIFGPNGKLSQVLTALEGRVTYVRGNHDMEITSQDLDKIQNPKGYKIKFEPDIYRPLGQRILCAHGHQFTMFNSSLDRFLFGETVPLGHYVTRAVQYKQERDLKPGQTVADLRDQGNPNGIDLSPLMKTIIAEIESPSEISVAGLLIDYIAQWSEMPGGQEIVLPNGQHRTLNDAKATYRNLATEWTNACGDLGDSQLAAIKAAWADATGHYMGWWAQAEALQDGADLVVMGHTHSPKSGLHEALVLYVNSGFGCPSKPDVGKKPPTFVTIDVDDCHAEVLQVVFSKGSYEIEPCDAPHTWVVAPWSFDYSCYIIVDNTNSDQTLARTGYTAEQGYYTVAPPEQIEPGEQGRFWIQDSPGIHGSRGGVQYSFSGRTGQINLKYECPTFPFVNSCSGLSFFTKSDGKPWGALNHIEKWNHPFFVKFVAPPAFEWMGDEQIVVPGKDAPLTDCRPALAVYGNKLYLVYKSYSDNTIWWSWYDGKQWEGDERVVSEKYGGPHTSAVPALAVYGNKLYLVHEPDADGTIWWSWYDGKQWGGDEQIVSEKYGGPHTVDSPALAVYDNKLHMVYRGAYGYCNTIWWSWGSPA
jgi:predicted phosphodiesterase